MRRIVFVLALVGCAPTVQPPPAKAISPKVDCNAQRQRWSQAVETLKTATPLLPTSSPTFATALDIGCWHGLSREQLPPFAEIVRAIERYHKAEKLEAYLQLSVAYLDVTLQGLPRWRKLPSDVSELEAFARRSHSKNFEINTVRTIAHLLWDVRTIAAHPDLQRLVAPTFFHGLEREEKQLLLVTLQRDVLPRLPMAARSRFKHIVAAVRKAHAQSEFANPNKYRIYEPLMLPKHNTRKFAAGGFSFATFGNEVLFTEIRQTAAGEKRAYHAEFFVGDAELRVICSRFLDASRLSAAMHKRRELKETAPNRFSGTLSNGNQEYTGILSFGATTCVASVVGSRLNIDVAKQFVDSVTPVGD